MTLGELKLRDPETLVLGAFGVCLAVAFMWGLPGSDTWCADSISPRSCGLGAIVETYWTGHFHTYPPLHMALLTILSLPWIGLAASRVGFGRDALEGELVKPLYMTGIEITSRLVSGAMALAIVWNTMRLWSRLAGRRVGIGAGLVLACNATLVYYAHTGNLDVPNLFWVCWALVEVDRVASGEPREAQALLLATCAVLTKDQAAAALALPILLYLVLFPWLARRASIARRGLMTGTLGAVALYAAVSGAIVNPTGFARRIAFVFGPASQPWAGYPASLEGRLALVSDMVRALPHFGSWPLALLAAVGVALAALSEGRWRMLLPFAGAVSFTLLFNLSARRSEDRFLLPQSVLLLPYASLAFDRLRSAASRGWSTALASGVGVAAAIPALLGVASLLATLLTDPRYEAEKYLAAQPKGEPIEVYGTAKFLPRIPRDLVATRPGVEPTADRERLPGVTELVDPSMDPRPRAPALIVLSTDLSQVELPFMPGAPSRRALAPYRDEVSRAFLRRLHDGSLGYARVLRATCPLAWPLKCHKVHGSTAEEVWIYAPASSGSEP
jgi:hypothetical protein